MSAVDPAPRRRRAQAPVQPGRSRARAILAVVAVVLALGVAADMFAAAAPPQPIPPVEQGPATAGTWFCPSVAGEGERATLTIAAVGDEASNVIVDRYANRRPIPDDVRTVEPGASAVVELTGEDATAPTAVRWTGGPVVTSWRVDGERTASATCEPAPAEQWYIPGFNSVRGSAPKLHLFNPFTADAVVQLIFATVEGPDALALTENVPVGAGRTTTINLRDFKPEEPDLAVTVKVLAGRVVAQGEQTIDPPGKASGATGRLLLPAATRTSESWAFAYAADGGGTESWLSVLNPGDDEAAVQFRVSNPSDNAGSFVGEVNVPPGGVSRIELAGVSKSPGFGVIATVVNSEPVVISRLTALRTARGIAVTGGLGSPVLSERAALVGAGAGNRTGLISLYNPGPEPARVDLLTQGAPPRWSGLVLGPNVRKIADLSAAGADRVSIPVLVVSDVPIVSEVRSRATQGSALRLWLSPGVAEATWVGPLSRPAVRRDPTLGTHAGEAPPSEDPLVPEVEDTPSEAPSE